MPVFLKFILITSSGWFLWKLAQLIIVATSGLSGMQLHYLVFGGITCLMIDVGCAYGLIQGLKPGVSDNQIVAIALIGGFSYLVSNIIWGVFIWQHYASVVGG